MKAWKVTHPDNWRQDITPIFNNGMREVFEDTVYYSNDMDAHDVKSSLINHDGYNSEIEVV